jgi:hypothetical protein
MSLPRLLIRFLAFTLPLVALTLAIDAKFRRIPTSYGVKRAWLEAHGGDIEVLVLGSSSAFNGVQPKFFRAPAYNAGNVAQSIYYDHEILSRYLGSMKALKLVFLLFDYQTLEYHFEDGIESWRQFFYYHEYGFRPEGGVDPYDVRFTSVLQLYPPNVRVRCVIATCDQTDGMDEFGWAPTPTESVNDGPFWFEMDNELRHESYLVGNQALLEEDLAMLQARDIGAALVVPPVYSSFSSLVGADVRARTASVLTSLAGRHKARYVDYFNDSRFDGRDFANSTHLNESGAEKFSRILDDELVGPDLRGEPMIGAALH